MLQLGQPFIDWSDGLLKTGFSPIDCQHQWLLSIVNILIHVCMGNTMQINLVDVLDALYDYTCIHFTEEELLFMNNLYPFLLSLLFLYFTQYSERNLHKAQHIVIFLEWFYMKDFLNTVVNLKKEVGAQNNVVLSKQTLDYVINWLTNHIRVMDVSDSELNEL